MRVSMITLARDMRKATNQSSHVMNTAMPETTLRGKLAQGCVLRQGGARKDLLLFTFPKGLEDGDVGLIVTFGG